MKRASLETTRQLFAHFASLDNAVGHLEAWRDNYDLEGAYAEVLGRLRTEVDLHLMKMGDPADVWEAIQAVSDKVTGVTAKLPSPPISIKESLDGRWFWKVGNVGGSCNNYGDCRNAAANEASAQHFGIPINAPERVRSLSVWSNE